MIYKTFFQEGLAHFSYLLGSDGQAVIIDPKRDPEFYIAEAANAGLRIVAVAETHIHADYASGGYELAERTGATLFVSGTGPSDWRYAFADLPWVTEVGDGDEFWVGQVRIDVMATPGHTPEHITFIATDTKASEEPFVAFTGDFIFVGDVGRPDLLERAAGFEGTMEAGAKTLFTSLQRFLERYEDDLILAPAHGAGSACGKSLGQRATTTLGYEKRTNWGLKPQSEAEFVEEVLAGQPEPPHYFKEMKRINKQTPDFGSSHLLRLVATDALKEGVQLLDVRASGVVATGFIPGSIHAPLDSGFTQWAGFLLRYDEPIIILASSPADAQRAAYELGLIGLTRVLGWVEQDALRAYERQGRLLSTIGIFSVDDVMNRPSSIKLVDVRSAVEFALGSIPGAQHRFVGKVLRSPTPEGRWVAFCGGGTRAFVAAVALKKQGASEVAVMPGGFSDWVANQRSQERSA